MTELKSAWGARIGDTIALSVEAASPDGGELSYQWYKTPYDSDVGGAAIEGAIGPTFDPTGETWFDPQEAYYYYVEVTNTKAAANGDALRSVSASNPAMAGIYGVGGVLAVQVRERVIPQTDAGAEAASIAPVSRLTADFAAGPNPIGKSSGVVNFFRSGPRVKSAALSVFDASGNAVRKINIADNASANTGKRPIGSWDLADKKGRPVPAGVYLVKGVIKTADKKSEKVSVAVGVR
jgi:hypothetical protein